MTSVPLDGEGADLRAGTHCPRVRVTGGGVPKAP